jgi:UDP-N-acetylglucosamine 4-epimerase
MLPKSTNSKSTKWCVTGCAGFIGSHLIEKLLQLGHEVVGIDNFSTGRVSNLEAVEKIVGANHWKKFKFIEGDINDSKKLAEGFAGVSYILHQAAVGSVPRSIEDPLRSHTANVNGFINLLAVAKESESVCSIVYASSSSVYGDIDNFPMVEEKVGSVLSPYAATKKIDEIYADVFQRCYGMHLVGLRYFNVFGPRQDPNGPYAAVIPRWAERLFKGEKCEVFGDGTTSRDFCFVENVVQANILAAEKAASFDKHEVFNIALGGETSLNELYQMLRTEISKVSSHQLPEKPDYKPFRAGDLKRSKADISKAQNELGYQPRVDVSAGVIKTVASFL